MANAPNKPDIQTFVIKLGRLIARLILERAHVDIVITVQDGNIRLVRTNRTYLPDNLPDV